MFLKSLEKYLGVKSTNQWFQSKQQSFTKSGNTLNDIKNILKKIADNSNLGSGWWLELKGTDDDLRAKNLREKFKKETKDWWKNISSFFLILKSSLSYLIIKIILVATKC